MHDKATRLAQNHPYFHSIAALDSGLTAFVQGKLEEALQVFLEARASARAAEASHLEAAAEFALAATRHRLGDSDASSPHLSAALALVEARDYFISLFAQPELAEDLRLLLEGSRRPDLAALIEAEPQAPDRTGGRDAAWPSPVAAWPSPVASRPAVVEIRCLGPLEVSVGPTPVSWPRKKAKALLALLLMAEQSRSREELIDHLFPDAIGPKAQQLLYNLTSSLRRILAPAGGSRTSPSILVVGDHRYRLDTERCWLDLREFELACTKGMRLHRQGLAEEAIQALARAAELYRGDLFEDPELADWFEIERHRYHIKAVEALLVLSELHDQHGRFDEARASALALRQYRLCAEVLGRELGAAPSSQTRDLLREFTGISAAD